LCVEEDIAVEEIIHDKQDVEHLPATIFSDYYGSEDLFPLDSNHEDHLPLSQMELENSEDSQQSFSVLHMEEIGDNYKANHQQKHSSFQLEQQQEEVFLCGFYDPIGDYLESLSNIDAKLFLSNDGWFCCFLNGIFVFHGFLHSSFPDQEFYQLINVLYGFIGSTILPNLRKQMIR
jgi:hypothetical protein